MLASKTYLTKAAQFVYYKYQNEENVLAKKFSCSACCFLLCFLPVAVPSAMAFVGDGHFRAAVFYRFGLERADIPEPGTPALAEVSLCTARRCPIRFPG